MTTTNERYARMIDDRVDGLPAGLQDAAGELDPIAFDVIALLREHGFPEHEIIEAITYLGVDECLDLCRSGF